MSSVVKKYLMALTGLVMVLFVLGHMVGNLQMFSGAEKINRYAHFLQHMPMGMLWVVRGVLLVCVLVHVWMAVVLTRENRAARGRGPEVIGVVKGKLSSRTMGVTGSVILLFIVFHIGHFTLRVVYPEYQGEGYYTVVDGVRMYDVYKMVVDGFSKTWVSVFYIIGMGCLSMHLSHGVQSMFQTLGMSHGKWRGRWECLGRLYGWVIFLGFIAIPVAVMLSKYVGCGIFKVNG